MAELDLLDEGCLPSPVPDAGFGSLATSRGHLPLQAMAVQGRLTGLCYRTTLTQTFVNVFAEPLEATYVFPLEDRAGVTRFRLRVKDRVVEGELQERGQARRTYDQAIRDGHRAAIAEQERTGVFTMRAGNIPPGEEVTVEIELSGPLQVADGEATFRFPLVVAPRYIPGAPLPGASVGSGVAPDTDAVPDASRITPPVLLPGQPNPVRLSMSFEVDPAGLPISDLRASLHQLQLEELPEGLRRVSLRPDVERLDRDFVLRFRVASEGLASGLTVHPDPEGGGGTFALTVVPPSLEAAGVRPRDVLVVLDRSGSMGGWKMVAARRAAGRLVDTLTHHDRFAVLLFDDRMEVYAPEEGGKPGLLPATDRNRFRAVEFLSGAEARGGTEMGQALDHGVALFDAASEGREKVMVFVTDGQVGNEDQLLWQVRRQARGIRIFAIGIDRAVNAGFLRRLARPTGGTCELVESEDRLDDVMRAVYRRVGSPVLQGLRIESGLEVDADSLAPDGECDVFPGVPAVLYGRYLGAAPESVPVVGELADGSRFREKIPVGSTEESVIAVAWARSRLLDLEHRYVTSGERDRSLADRITRISLDHGVLCRFTAFVAVDRSEVVNRGGEGHRVTQPVEPAEGWAMLSKSEQAAAPRDASFSCDLDMELLDDIGGDSGETFGGSLGTSFAEEGGFDLGGVGYGGAPKAAPEPAPTLTGGPPPAPCPAPAPAPKKHTSSSSRGGPLDGLMGGLDDAVTGIARKLAGVGKKRRRQTAAAAPPSSRTPLQQRFGAELASLLEHAVRAIQTARDAEAVRENLRFLIADLEDLLERARTAGLGSDPVLVGLTEVAAGLGALAEEDHSPGSAPLVRWLSRLERLLDPASPQGSEGDPAPREDFWI